jgi:hypothetical protein
MKKILCLTTAIISLGLAPVFAQFGAPASSPQGPHFDGAMDKLFGDHQTFSALLELQTIDANTNPIVMPGKISFDHGRTRFEMNMSEMQNTNMPANVGAMMKSMGMDTIIVISRPDRNLAYLVYPGLQSYAETTPADKTASANLADYKVEITELGRETVDRHACIKNHVVVTDKDDNKRESTVWNATDLNNFPVKITTADQGQPSTMLFKNISLQQPAAGSFEPPSGLTKYASVQTMMQTEMMKKMGGGLGMPPKQN